jgi:hypothetical protein
LYGALRSGDGNQADGVDLLTQAIIAGKQQGRQDYASLSPLENGDVKQRLNAAAQGRGTTQAPVNDNAGFTSAITSILSGMSSGADGVASANATRIGNMLAQRPTGRAQVPQRAMPQYDFSALGNAAAELMLELNFGTSGTGGVTKPTATQKEMQYLDTQKTF